MNAAADYPACPFCGGMAQDDFIVGESYVIECYVCGANSGVKDSPEEAIATWSRRVVAALLQRVVAPGGATLK
jgi:Lar family restriction alleviation protein